MPFYPLPGNESANVQLEQSGAKRFVVVRGFLYRLPDGSDDFAVTAGMETDLASVPWSLWWLVASYGRHTRAALVHDSLIGDDAAKIVERKYADWVFLTALEDTPPGEKPGSWLRHQFMWAAVCLFGTMREGKALFLFVAFLAQLALFWAALIMALVGWMPWGLTDKRWIVVAVVWLAGFLWAFNPFADRRAGWKLWPLAVIGLPLVAPAGIAVWATVIFIWLVEYVPSKLSGRGTPPIVPTYRAP